MKIQFVIIIIYLQFNYRSTRSLLSHQKKLYQKENETKLRFDDKYSQNFSFQIFSGKWQTPRSSQIGFLNSKKGLINLALNYIKGREEYINFAVEIYEDLFLDSKYIFAQTRIPIGDLEKNSLKTFSKNIYFNLYKNISYKVESIKCNLSINLELLKNETSLIDIRNDQFKDYKIRGTLTSKDCYLDLKFESEIEKVNKKSFLIYLFINIIALFLNFIPLFKALKSGNYSELLKLNEDVLLFNIIMDVILFSMNLVLATMVVYTYLEFFIFFSIIHICFIISKIKIHLEMFKEKTLLKNLDYLEFQKEKIHFFFKFVFFISLSIITTMLFFVHYYFFILFQFYPIFQIIQNFKNFKNNTFSFKFNILFFLPQLLSLFSMKGYPCEFTLQKGDTIFMIILLIQQIIFILILSIQNKFGPTCFLPKFLNPYYFDHSKMCDLSENLEKEMCPICYDKFEKDSNDDYNSLKTPCGHFFHGECLKKWMQVKFLCPCCRKHLPIYNF